MAPSSISTDVQYFDVKSMELRFYANLQLSWMHQYHEQTDENRFQVNRYDSVPHLLINGDSVYEGQIYLVCRILIYKLLQLLRHSYYPTLEKDCKLVTALYTGQETHSYLISIFCHFPTTNLKVFQQDIMWQIQKEQSMVMKWIEINTWFSNRLKNVAHFISVWLDRVHL